MPLPRLLSLLLLGPLLLSCRNHPQAEGGYRLRATAVTADGCGLVGGDGTLGALALRTYGNEVQATLTLEAPALELALDGRFLRDLEVFRVAGSAAEVPLRVQGLDCEIQLIQAVLLAHTREDGLALEGPLEITYDDLRQPACGCVLEAEVRAEWIAPAS